MEGYFTDKITATARREMADIIIIEMKEKKEQKFLLEVRLKQTSANPNTRAGNSRSIEENNADESIPGFPDHNAAIILAMVI